MTGYMYTLWDEYPLIELINTSSHTLGFFVVVVFLVRTFFYSLSKSQLYDTGLSVTVTMLNIRSFRPHSSDNWKFVIFYQPLAISSTPIPWWPLFYSPFVSVALISFSNSTFQIPLHDTMQCFSFSLWLISLSSRPPGLLMLSLIAVFPFFFLSLNNITL